MKINFSGFLFFIALTHAASCFGDDLFASAQQRLPPKATDAFLDECLNSTNPAALLTEHVNSPHVARDEIYKLLDMIGESTAKSSKRTLHEYFISLPPAEAAPHVSQKLECAVLRNLVPKLNLMEKEMLFGRILQQELDGLRRAWENSGTTLYYPQQLLAQTLAFIDSNGMVEKFREICVESSKKVMLGDLARIELLLLATRHDMRSAAKMNDSSMVSTIIAEIQPRPDSGVPYAIYNSEDKNAYSDYLEKKSAQLRDMARIG